MIQNSPEAYVSGISFLAIASLAVRITWKLQRSAEAQYEKRALSQVETIAKLELQIDTMREQINDLYKHNLKLALEVNEREETIAALEHRIKVLEAKSD